ACCARRLGAAAHREARPWRRLERAAVGHLHLARSRARLLHLLAGRILHHVVCVRRVPGDTRAEARAPLSLQDLFALDFMRNAFIAGPCIALASGLVGYFVVLRNQVFAADALGHTAFTGSLGGVLLGLNVLVGAFASCIAVAVTIGTLGGRGRGRDVAVGTVFAWVLGLGALFLSLYTSPLSAGSGALAVTGLFGPLLR